jgi:8-oxo-dGTP pyrophosphatase MutT (NUDIX family)
MPTPTVRAIDRLELAFAPRRWPFADVRRAEIGAYFSSLVRDNATLFNGEVLVMHEYSIVDGVLRGQYLKTDYASFLAWRDWGFPDASVRNCFALAAVRGSDGGYLLGVMGQHTSNPGRIYFPGGTPDEADIVEGRVDLDLSVRRELEEETGLTADEFDVESGWMLVLDGARLALIKRMQARVRSAALRERVLQHLARERRPELAGVQFVTRRDDLTEMVPAFTSRYLDHVWSSEEGGAAE